MYCISKPQNIQDLLKRGSIFLFLVLKHKFLFENALVNRTLVYTQCNLEQKNHLLKKGVSVKHHVPGGIIQDQQWHHLKMFVPRNIHTKCENFISYRVKVTKIKSASGYGNRQTEVQTYRITWAWSFNPGVWHIFIYYNNW